MRFVALLIWIIPLVGLVLCVAMVLLGASCHVYEEPAQCGRAHPGGGVTVNVRELGDEDGGEP